MPTAARGPAALSRLAAALSAQHGQLQQPSCSWPALQAHAWSFPTDVVALLCAPTCTLPNPSCLPLLLFIWLPKLHPSPGLQLSVEESGPESVAKAKQQIMGKLRWGPGPGACKTQGGCHACWACHLQPFHANLRTGIAAPCSGSLTDPLGQKQQQEKQANGAARGKSGTTFMAESGACLRPPMTDAASLPAHLRACHCWPAWAGLGMWPCGCSPAHGADRRSFCLVCSHESRGSNFVAGVAALALRYAAKAWGGVASGDTAAPPPQASEVKVKPGEKTFGYDELKGEGSEAAGCVGHWAA